MLDDDLTRAPQQIIAAHARRMAVNGGGDGTGRRRRSEIVHGNSSVDTTMILILISVSSEQFERGELRPQTAVLALKRLIYFATFARVAELVDARDLGSRAVRRTSSSLAFRTRQIGRANV